MPLHMLYGIFTVLLGLVFGSFLNVCIYRIPKKEPIVFGRSHCMSCGTTLKPIDLVPVFSFIFLGGKCRHCKAKISIRYPLVELLNTGLWISAFYIFGYSFKTLTAFAFISGLIVLSFIDIDTKTIPNGLVIYLLVVGALNCIADNSSPLYGKLIGIFACGLPLLVIALVIRGGMGGGDVKFAFAAGLFLGWQHSLLALFIAFVTGAVFGLVYMLITKKDGKSPIPFAPFLSLGMVISMFFGDSLIRFYLSLFS